MLMSHLAAELSHDMRVPLTSIIASLELLEEELGDRPDPAVAALLDRTTLDADRMMRMLDQHLARMTRSRGAMLTTRLHPRAGC